VTAASPDGPGPSVVVARPVRSARFAVAVAVPLIVVFAVIGALLPDSSQGVTFTAADQVGVAGMGLLLGILILTLTRPRLRADRGGVDTRGFFGGYRHVDWDLVRAVEFPPKVRFARLVLPGDELIPLYAVQRADAERSVVVMDALRTLRDDVRHYG
jgi:hypothetical protein